MSALPPTPVVCAVIRRHGQILLARRPEGKRLAGLWEFPGGKIEPGETPAEALHRELQEELGCQVIITRAIGVVEHPYEWGGIELHGFVCELAPGSPAPHPHEHTALIWVAADELGQYELAPADLPVLRRLRPLD